MFRDYLNYFKVTGNTEKNIKHLDRMSFHNENIDSDIRHSWEQYKTEYANSLLKIMSIDRLNDVESGMPIGILKDYEFNFVYDCIGLNQQYFARFPGIGEVKSRRIVVATDALQRAVFEELDFRIRDNESSEKLLKNIHRKIDYHKKEQDIRKFENEKAQFIKSSKSNLKLVNKMKLIVPWFIHKDKASIFEAMEDLSEHNIEEFKDEYEHLVYYKKPKSLKKHLKKIILIIIQL